MIKVGDFGLSRDIYTTDYYKMSNFGLCPIKWMSPEMIRDGISSEKSDVVSVMGAFTILLPSIFHSTPLSLSRIRLCLIHYHCCTYLYLMHH